MSKHFKQDEPQKLESIHVRELVAFFLHNAVRIVLLYIVFKLLLFAGVFLMNQLAGFLLWHANRPAFTSGDLPYLLRSWEGWGLALVGLLILVLYTTFEVSTIIILSAATLHDERPSALEITRRALATAHRMLSPLGIVVVLYTALAGPLVGASVGISLTSNFYIPDFILSVINGNLVLRVLYTVLLVALGIVGFVYIFAFHGVALDDVTMGKSLRHSSQIVRRNVGALLKSAVKLLLFVLVTMTVIFLVLTALFALGIVVSGGSTDNVRFCTLFCTGMGTLLIGALLTLLEPLVLMLITWFYENACGRACDLVDDRAGGSQPKRRLAIAAGCVVIVGAMAGISLYAVQNFDELFPATSSMRIVAHRGGGSESYENTAEGIRAAGDLGVYGSEIDIQRTADGAYVVNHDGTFKRLCGDDRKSSEMTLAEIKQLRVRSEANPLAEGVEVPTLDEALDASENRVHLFIELKGETADEQMAEDAYAAVAARGMLDQCAFISLDYELISYLEAAHPDAETGYLIYLSFGELEQMNCDLLLVEMETATTDNIARVHQAGKQIGVWTVNDMTSVVTCSTRGADYIITDEVRASSQLLEGFYERDDVARIFDTLFAWL